MPVTYDRETDALYVRLPDTEHVAIDSQKILDDVRIIDYSAAGAVVGIEFLDASEGIDLTDVPFASIVEDQIDQSGQTFKVFA